MDPHLAEDEDLQKIKEWWKNNGSSIVIGVVVGLGAIVGINGWSMYSDHRAETASALYFELREQFQAGDVEAAGELARELREDFSGTPYAVNGALLAARLLAENDNADGAADMLAWAMENSEDANLAHAARLRLAYIVLEQGDTARAVELASVTDAGSYASHFAELRADALRQAGDAAGAREAYDEAIAALTPGSGYEGVLRAKRNSVAQPN